MNSSDPWSWRPPLAPWFERVEARLATWSPKRIELERIDDFRAAIAPAAAEGAHWLYHPFCTSLYGDGALSATFGEAQLVAWAAAQLPGLDVFVRIGAPERLWRTDGTATQVSGSIDASELAELMVGGRPGADSSQCPLVLRPDEAEAVECGFLCDGLQELWSALPAVEEWVCGRTRALNLLPEGFFASAPEGALVSCSSPEVPGFIRVSRCSEVLKLLEMVVHETAHLHLFTSEMTAPLIGSSSTLLFSSPLRHEPRPLRGILLALHACAYIAAAYAEARRSGLEAATKANAERLRVLALFEESREIVAVAKAHLTPEGLDFVERTETVADWARAS